jgi:uncharacterized MAPEG superfamily protein
MLDIVRFRAVLHVNIAFVVLYYCFLYIQAGTKFVLYFAAKEKDPKASLSKIKYGSTDRLALTSDRTVGNLMEQSIPFLLGLWLCAVVESPDYAATIGWYWLISRAMYPFVFYYGIPYLLLSTLPGYAFITMLFWPVVTKTLFTV